MGFLIVILVNVSGSVIQPIIYAFSVTQLFYFQLNEISVSTVEGMGRNPNIAEFEARNADTTQTYTKDINQFNELTLEELQVIRFRGYMTDAESGLPRNIVHVNQEENLADGVIMKFLCYDDPPNLYEIVESCVRPRLMSAKVIPGMLMGNVLDAKTYAGLNHSVFRFSRYQRSFRARMQTHKSLALFCKALTPSVIRLHSNGNPKCLRSMSRWINSR